MGEEAKVGDEMSMLATIEFKPEIPHRNPGSPDNLVKSTKASLAGVMDGLQEMKKAIPIAEDMIIQAILDVHRLREKLDEIDFLRENRTY